MLTRCLAQFQGDEFKPCTPSMAIALHACAVLRTSSPHRSAGAEGQSSNAMASTSPTRSNGNIPCNACGSDMVAWAAEARLAQALGQCRQVAPRQEARPAVRRRRGQLLPPLPPGQYGPRCSLRGRTILGSGAVTGRCSGPGLGCGSNIGSLHGSHHATAMPCHLSSLPLPVCHFCLECQRPAFTAETMHDRMHCNAPGPASPGATAHHARGTITQAPLRPVWQDLVRGLGLGYMTGFPAGSPAAGAARRARP